MPGMNRVVIGDADSLVALASKNDANHERARKIVKALKVENYVVVYPNTAILEAMVALKRKLNLNDKAQLIARQFLRGVIRVIWVEEEIQKNALNFLMENSKSKKNTVFDCLVVASAKKISAVGIFSFDKWYSRLGFKLAHELI